jgi:hypothetical protein
MALVGSLSGEGNLRVSFTKGNLLG